MNVRAGLPRGVVLTEAQRFLLLAVLIGVCTGLVIVCFHAAIELVDFAVHDTSTAAAFRILWPAIGAAVAALIVHVSPAGAGSGIVQTKSALYVSNGHIPFAAVPGKFAACVLSIGTGTPLGPEDPALLMGAGIASRLGRLFGLTRQTMRLIAPTGAAAGIAAAFNTPITGVLFVLEEVVAGFDAAVLGSIVLAAVASVVTSRLFLGESPLFSVPEVAGVTDPREVLVYVALGLAAGVFATIYVRGMDLVRYRFGAVHLPPAVGPLVAGGIVGAVGLIWPEVLGTGYRAMDAALHGQYSWSTMATLALVKMCVAGVAFGAGTPGGLFAPTLFLGVMLGGAFSGLVPHVWPTAPGPQAMLVLAGMAGLFAGVFRAPMTAVFMAFELSGTAAGILPAMITSTLGFLVARQLHRQSILDLVAEHEGASLPSARLLRAEQPLHVEDAMSPPPEPREAAPLRVTHRPQGGWVLVESEDADPSRARILEPVYPDELIDVALRRLARAPVVPVISRLDESRLLGVVTYDDIRRAYGFAQGG